MVRFCVSPIFDEVKSQKMLKMGIFKQFLPLRKMTKDADVGKIILKAITVVYINWKIKFKVTQRAFLANFQLTK